MHNKIQQLLKLSTANSGASIHEAHTAASIALKMARESGDGQLVARARVALHKASRRLDRAA